MTRFANDFHSWLCHSWKSLATHLTRDPKIVIHGNSCIIPYVIRLRSISWEMLNIAIHEIKVFENYTFKFTAIFLSDTNTPFPPNQELHDIFDKHTARWA